ncbi:unnamed protein product, partial [Mycena citricolor]
SLTPHRDDTTTSSCPVSRLLQTSECDQGRISGRDPNSVQEGVAEDSS